MAQKITPVALSKKLGVRPQQIFNWIKQGCPAYQIAGKNHVDPDEVEEWLANKEVTKAKKKKEAAQKRSQSDAVGNEASTALGKFRPQKIEHWCPNCQKETTYLCDLMFTGDPMENYVSSYCVECRLNRSLQPNIPNEFMKAVLLEGQSLWVPCRGMGSKNDLCPTHKGHECTLLTYADGTLEFCKECGLTIDHDPDGRSLMKSTKSEPDAEDVKPYKPNKEDRKTVNDDKMAAVKEAANAEG